MYGKNTEKSGASFLGKQLSRSAGVATGKRLGMCGRYVSPDEAAIRTRVVSHHSSQADRALRVVKISGMSAVLEYPQRHPIRAEEYLRMSEAASRASRTDAQ